MIPIPSAAHRPLPVRARPDLVAQHVDCRGLRRLRLKDPVSLEYFQLDEEEYSILKMLDGCSSLAQIQHNFDQQFAPRH